MIHAEVALYPLKNNNATQVINSSIQSLQGQGVSYQVGPIDTHIHGSEEQVWNSLKQLFDKAKSTGGEVSMVVTITNAAD